MERAVAATKMVTRGNLDGIACAAVFLDRFPSGEVTFVSSPHHALRELRSDRASARILLADIPLTPRLAVEMEADSRTELVDHHPTDIAAPRCTIDTGRSAAGVLHYYLGSSPRPAPAVALADLYERGESGPLAETITAYGAETLRAEARVLDFAWRHNIEDDRFRILAARSMSDGSWPSEVPEIRRRYEAMVAGGRWERAVQRAREGLSVHGGLAVLDMRFGRSSLHGFGSMALTEAARERGCGYAMFMYDARGCSIVSLRSCGGGDLDLGRFISRFTGEHGVEGGGHRSSAGARIPTDAADLLIDELATAVG
ncbi:MAG: hypothetical protein ISF22_04200 [Methanomassiliicoccus sp.]|nr:hypothetical protein [Methanomassiliicoccus sp.]